MKILVINLLRLGDVLMTVPVINGLKKSRRDAQIDMLTFKPAASLHGMLPAVRKWWTLDRDGLQNGLGRADIPLLTSFSLLQEQLDQINAQEYDLIVNLTQTHFSAWIAGYLKSPDRLGLTYDLKGNPHFYSPWFRYLDERADGDVQDVFHHTDIFAHACGLGSQARDWSLKAVASAKHEISSLDLKGEVVVLQMFTSDEKKNWPVEKWQELVSRWRACSKSVKFIALGSPAEREKIETLCDLSVGAVQPAILSLDGALHLLNRASLLITGDTSIKHLANGADCKVLELCLGWSDYRRTGAYKAGSIILRPNEGADLDVESVFVSARALMNEDQKYLDAHAYAPLTCIVTKELSTGFWLAQKLHSSDAVGTMAMLVERCAWKLALNLGRGQDFIEFGSEGKALSRELRELIPGEISVLEHLDFLEKKESEVSAALHSEIVSLKRERPLRLEQVDIAEIAGFRKKQIALESSARHTEFKTKLIRTLKSNWTERI